MHKTEANQGTNQKKKVPLLDDTLQLFDLSLMKMPRLDLKRVIHSKHPRNLEKKI